MESIDTQLGTIKIGLEVMTRDGRKHTVTAIGETRDNTDHIRVKLKLSGFGQQWWWTVTTQRDFEKGYLGYSSGEHVYDITELIGVSSFTIGNSSALLLLGKGL